MARDERMPWWNIFRCTWWWPRWKVPTFIMLHSVNDEVPPEFVREGCANNAIRPSELEALATMLLANGYRFSTFRDAVLHGNARTACLTFDDGLADNFTMLLPILRRMKIQATCFVTNRGANNPEFLSEGQLREMAASGLVEIGGHTSHHVKLDEVPLDEAEREIRENKRWLEDVLGCPVTSFCYPKGGENDAIVELVKAAGYTCAAAMRKKMRPPAADPFRIHRQIIPRGMAPWKGYLLATRGRWKI